jgi:hypothetical protein
MAGIEDNSPLGKDLMPRGEILTLLQKHLHGWPDLYPDPEPVKIERYLGIWNDFVSIREEFAEYVQTVAMFFACSISPSEIDALYRKKAKVSELVDILAERAPRRRLSPMVVLGKPCLPAAVFEELLRAASAIKGQPVEAGPSTHLITVLDRHQLRQLLCLAGFFFPEVLTRSDRIWRSRAYDVDVVTSWTSLAVFLGVLIAWYVWIGFRSVGGILTAVGVAGLLAIWPSVQKRLFRYVDQRRSPFNERVETFRDLVDFLLGEGGDRYIDLPHQENVV